MKTLNEYINESTTKDKQKVKKFWNDAWDEDLDSLVTTKDICVFIEELGKYNASISSDIEKILVDRFKQMFKEFYL